MSSVRNELITHINEVFRARGALDERATELARMEECVRDIKGQLDCAIEHANEVSRQNSQFRLAFNQLNRNLIDGGNHPSSQQQMFIGVFGTADQGHASVATISTVDNELLDLIIAITLLKQGAAERERRITGLEQRLFDREEELNALHKMMAANATKSSELELRLAARTMGLARFSRIWQIKKQL